MIAWELTADLQRIAFEVDFFCLDEATRIEVAIELPAEVVLPRGRGARERSRLRRVDVFPALDGLWCAAVDRQRAGDRTVERVVAGFGDAALVDERSVR